MATRYPKGWKKFRQDREFGPFIIVVSQSGEFGIVHDEDHSHVIDFPGTVGNAVSTIKKYVEKQFEKVYVAGRPSSSYFSPGYHYELRKVGEVFFDRNGRQMHNRFIKKPDAEKEQQVEAIRTKMTEYQNEINRLVDEATAVLESMEDIE